MILMRNFIENLFNGVLSSAAAVAVVAAAAAAVVAVVAAVRDAPRRWSISG